MADRPARVEITADSRSLGAGLREASAKLASFAATSSRVVGRYSAASVATLGGAAKNAGAAVFAAGRRMLPYATAAAGAVLVKATTQVRDFEEGLIRLRINASATAEQIDGVRRSVRAASSATGVDSRKILAGIQQYVDLTGDFAGATEQVATFARTAQAADASVGDVAATAAAMRDALKIDPTQMEAAFSAMITQGKAGSITMKQLAAELSQLAPTIAQFKGGTGLDGLRELGAMMQILNKRYNSASESATAFQSLAVAVQSRASRLQAAGIKVFDVGPDGVKRPRELLEIIDEVGRSSLYKDPQKLFKAFGRAEAVEALQQIVRLRKEVDDLVKAGQDTGAVGRDIKTYQQSTVGKFAKLENDAKELGQRIVVDVAERGAKGYAGWRAGFSGEITDTQRKAARLQADDAGKRWRDLDVVFRYARQGVTISSAQARQVWNAEEMIAMQERLARLGVAPQVTPEQRAQLRQFQTVDGVGVGVDAAGQRFTVADMAAAFKQALAEAGLMPVVKIGGDAVLGAVRSSTGHARRP